jgi:hypothetical protein
LEHWNLKKRKEQGRIVVKKDIMLSKVGTQKSKNYGQYLVIFCRIKK